MTFISTTFQKRGIRPSSPAQNLACEIMSACSGTPVYSRQGSKVMGFIVLKKRVYLPYGAVIGDQSTAISQSDCTGSPPTYSTTDAGEVVALQVTKTRVHLTSPTDQSEASGSSDIDCSTICRDPIPCSDPETFPTFLQCIEVPLGARLWGAPAYRLIDFVRVAEKIWKAPSCPSVTLILDDSCQFMLYGSFEERPINAFIDEGGRFFGYPSSTLFNGRMTRIITAFPGFTPSVDYNNLDIDASLPNVWRRVGTGFFTQTVHRTSFSGSISERCRWVGGLVFTDNTVIPPVAAGGIMDFRRVGGNYYMSFNSLGYSNDHLQMIADVEAGVFPGFVQGVYDETARTITFSPPGIEPFAIEEHPAGDSIWQDAWANWVPTLDSGSLQVWRQPYYCIQIDPGESRDISVIEQNGVMLFSQTILPIDQQNSYAYIVFYEGGDSIGTVALRYRCLFAGHPIGDSRLSVDSGSGFVECPPPEIVEVPESDIRYLVFTASFDGVSFNVSLYV